MIAGLTWWIWGPRLGSSILLGTSIGLFNFMFLARGIAAAIDSTIAAQEASAQRTSETVLGGEGAGADPENVPDRPREVRSRLRLVLVLALIVGISWWSAISPVGIAVGVALVLVVASVAAHRHQRAR